ncbi:Inositol-pentakisphosphate 2-kinase [Trichoplax sp. H2]|nr:Inositol-pentakisphosphate 2-kinase [Trichoplax sp. H2]|eukprot:RDD46777.1 Inositol-pentakisphosphate 2-kinase [Trichoplax sp. H2]
MNVDSRFFAERKWAYKGEGNAHVVLASHDGFVVRLLKNRRDGQISRRSQDAVKYYNIVGPQFIDPSYLPEMRLVTVPKDFFGVVEDVCRKQRPDYRLDTNIAMNATATVMPDVCFVRERSRISEVKKLGNIAQMKDKTIPTFCVEIKPKCGYLPNPASSSEINDIRRRICYFCLLQYTKEKIDRWKNRSQYCPLDLFSLDLDRIKKALSALMYSPQNNFRIFKDGILIYEDDSAYESLDTILHEWFSNSKNSCKNLGATTENFREIIARILVSDQACGTIDINGKQSVNSNCILNQILCAQRLGETDIEDIYPLFLKLEHEMTKSKTVAEAMQQLECFDSASWKYLNVVALAEIENDVEETIRKIQQFLVTASFKDCSLMISVRPNKASISNAIQGRKSSLHYDYSVMLIDLDIKDISRIRKYMKLIKEVSKSYMERAEIPYKVCK